jgi:cobalt-zinc-cadmium resistance protein CzcA
MIGTQNINGQEQYFGADKRFQGFEVGLSIPLWFGPYSERVKAAERGMQMAQKLQEHNQLTLTQQYQEAVREVVKNKHSLDYYRGSALATASLITAQSQTAFLNGELDFTALLMNLRQALNIEEGYLSALQQYNQSLIIVDYLNGNK